jgi:hypothetical protein
MSASMGVSTHPLQPARKTPRQLMQDRGAAATRSLREALCLPTDLSDTTVLGTALAEVAAEEIWHNPTFSANLRSRYDELIAVRGRPTKRGSRQTKDVLPPLVPVGQLNGYVVDPVAAPDPHFLILLYGHHQLKRALQDYSLDMLKRTADELQQRYPGTRPTNRSRRKAVIAYIIEYVEKDAGL